MLFGQADGFTVGDLVLDACVHGVINHFIEVNEPFHAALSLRLLQLGLLWLANAHDASVLLFVLLELLLESAHVFLRCFHCLLRFQLVDISNKDVFGRRALALIRLILVNDCLQVAV